MNFAASTVEGPKRNLIEGSPPDTSRSASLTTTVPREYVHRASMSEVLLTDCRRVSDGRYALTGQWPRAHAFFTSADGGSHDPLQAAETIRQAALFIAHTELGVPLDHRFVPWDFAFGVHHESLVIGASPSNLDLDVECVDVLRAQDGTVEIVLDVVIRRAEAPLATGHLRFTCAPPLNTPDRSCAAVADGHHSCLRSRAAPPGDGAPYRSVVLGPAGRPGTWQLEPDPAHPVLFDGDGDDIPHLVALEAARQASAALLTADHALHVTDVSGAFVRQPDAERACWIDAAPQPVQSADALSVLVTARQGGHPVWVSQVRGRVLPR
ncbi:ScbA/BarX family gamma-butyrolactone biosynthesis protein [Streptomyces sp. NPDC047315]|uniref:ScbA/BarX family gamma-butyrolactone biosynthesis protein n=1 Tax=Streptomyces sp. NPDC047315 TaxID=3155142 RepID=UPI0033C88158